MPRPYDDRAWRTIRKLVLARDGHRCRIMGPRCLGKADAVDHIVDVADGGPRLDPANLRASCKPCNSSRSARRKHREGWRRSATRIVLVTGPPGGGKTTYVTEHAGRSDVVVDTDVLASALGSQVDHGHGSGSADAARAARNAVLRKLQRGEISAPKAWIISANPNAEDLFPHHAVVVCDPGVEEVEARCRRSRPASFLPLVADWYRQRDQAPGPSRQW